MSDWRRNHRYVVLHIGTGPSRLEESGASPLITTDARRRFDLRDDIWIERLDADTAKNIQTACEPPHHMITTMHYDRHLYAFVRRSSAIEKAKYEGMADLIAVLSLSRLVHPTSVGERYAAKVLDFGSVGSPIEAIQHRGASPDVFLSDKPRDWLSVRDGEELRRLMVWLDKPMHRRVHRAFWNHENAMRSYYLDQRWILIVSGFEALTNVDEKDSSRQFRDRVGQIAEELRFKLTSDELRLAYKLRSKLAHAKNFLFELDTILPRSQHIDLYEKLESLLRTTIKRCLLDETFGDLFRSDASVNSRWPLAAKPKN